MYSYETNCMLQNIWTYICEKKIYVFLIWDKTDSVQIIINFN